MLSFLRRVRRIFGDIVAIRHMPVVSIRLAYEETSRNDPFYRALVRNFFAETRRRHSKLPLVRRWSWGVALCPLPPTFEEYFMLVDGSARRNFRKASRKGYIVRRMDYNEHLEDVRAIHRSTDRRQGEYDGELRASRVSACNNPKSRSRCHDYVYFGVFWEDTLVAFAGCFIAGEVAMLEVLLGHAEYLQDAVVPLLIMEIVRDLKKNHSAVTHYTYGMYFGAGESMRRFKRKFGFRPHRVIWRLG